MVLSWTPANVNAVVSQIQSSGGTALGIVCDLGDGQQITRAVAEAAEVFGGVDILVNVAFDPTVVHSPILELTVEQLQRNLDMGPIAYLRMMQACYPYLKASGEGRIINFASLAGILGMSPYGPYNLAKEAVRALTRSAAREWGPDNITVNNLLPVADTWGAGVDAPAPTNALCRYGSPEEDVALFLASSDSRFITGSSLTPDGGQIIDSAR